MKKKIPVIPPLWIDDNFITDIQTKTNIFNKFFAEQCTLLKYSSVLPANQMFLRQSRLNSINFSEDEILKIIRALNIHRSHVRMIKICDKSLKTTNSFV